MSLFNKYRPNNFEEMMGNEDTLEAINTALDSSDPPHAILLSGPVGCGKTTVARIIASKLDCKGGDFREIDSADFRGIDTVRDIIRQSRFQPLESVCRVWLLDECHKLTNDAQTALLKTLEDAPSHAYFVLSTTDPDKLLATIRSRCSKFELKTLTDRQMFKLLRMVVHEEGDTLDQEVMDQIIMDSQGHPRDALQILEKTLLVGENKRLEMAKEQAEKQRQTIELCRALLSGAPWKKVANILNGLKEEEPESVRRSVLGYCSAVLLKEDNVIAAKVMEQFVNSIYYTGFPGLTYLTYCAVKLSQGDGF